MNNVALFFKYVAVMAGVTYLIRMVPLVLCKKKLTNAFVRSFLYYIPYAVLGAMTFPSIFYATGDTISAIAGCVTALVLAWFEKSLITVALCASFAVFVIECVMRFWL